MLPFSKSVQSPVAWARSKLTVAAGAALVGYTYATSYAANTVGAALKALTDNIAALAAAGGAGLVGFLQSGTGATQRTVQERLRDSLNVKDFGAVGDGVADDTAAIMAADAAACAGNLDASGNTVLAEREVYFPPGRYNVTGLAYRGAPWRGAGVAATWIDLYASSGGCIDAVGTSGARKILNISDMTLNGSNCTGTSAYGIRMGYNQRSLGALQRVKITDFPGPGLYFAAPSWMMSFHDVYVVGCARNTASVRTGVYIDPSIGALELLAFDWYNLWLEDNGFTGSAVGGGMDISSDAVDSWNFHGGTWEGNYGLAEARFSDAINVHVDGVYLESFAARTVNGLLFHNTFGSARNVKVAGETGMTGDGLKVSGTSNVSVEQTYSNIKWVNDISVADTAVVTLGGRNAVLEFSVASGATLNRLASNRTQLTDAPTIATDAAQANSFYVTLFDNRTMGAPTNPSLGQRITYTIIQNSITGSCILGWNAVFKQTWSDTGNTTGKRSSIQFEYDGTNWNQVGAQTAYV